MKQVLVIGARPFVRQLMLGGATEHVVEPAGAADALRAALANKEVGLVLVESALLEHVPQELQKQAFTSREPAVVTLGGNENAMLRRRVRQVLGADLLAERTLT